jgi:hypothetical protein
MPVFVFTNPHLLRDILLSWASAFFYPVLLITVVLISDSNADVGMLVLITSPVVLVFVLLTLRNMWTNIVSISKDGEKIEVIIRGLAGSEKVSGHVSDFSFRVREERFNRTRPSVMEIYFRNSRIARQYQIGFRRKYWVDEIAMQLKEHGISVKYGTAEMDRFV